MQRLVLFVAASALCSSCFPTSAQTSSVKLCVASMQVNGGINSDTAARDMLVKFLNKEKGDKALSIGNLPIAPAMPADALTAAKQEGCDYVVTTNQTENSSESSYWGASGVNLQTFFVTIAYKITKVNDGSDVLGASFKASDKGSAQNAIMIAMKKIADKVAPAIRKAGPVTK